MKAIIIQPDKTFVQEIDGWMGIKAVLDQGYLEAISIRKDLVAYIDEDGKAKRLPGNHQATEVIMSLLCESGRSLMPGDSIVGTMVLVGTRLSDTPGEGMVECDIPADVLNLMELTVK